MTQLLAAILLIALAAVVGFSAGKFEARIACAAGDQFQFANHTYVCFLKEVQPNE